MDGKDLTRLFLLNNYSDDLDTTNSGIKNINLLKKQKSDINIIKSTIKKNKRYIKKLKESPTIKNYRKSMYQLKQNDSNKQNINLINQELNINKQIGGYDDEENQDGSGWWSDTHSNLKNYYKDFKSNLNEGFNDTKTKLKDQYKKTGESFDKKYKKTKGYISEGRQDFKNNFKVLKNQYNGMHEEYDYHALKRKQAREGTPDSVESTPELDKWDLENPKWAAFYKKAREKGWGKYFGGSDSECSRESCSSHKGSGISGVSNILSKVSNHVNIKKLTENVEDEINKHAEKLGKTQKGLLKGLLGGKTKELYNYAITNNKIDTFPQAIGKMILTYGKKHGQKSIMKFGGNLKSLIENEIGGNINQFGDKLGGEVREIINKHIDNFNNKLNKISNMYADKYPSKYNNLMRKLDFKPDLNNLMKGGGNGGSNTLRYSPDLSANDMISLKIDHSDIKKNINLIDKKIKKLLKGGKKELLSGGSDKIDKIKIKFREYLIKRRILLDELVDLELKFNSVEEKDVLEDSNTLYRLDHEFRNVADNLGVGFNLDENTKKAFLNNRQLKLANDTLGDLSKSLNRKLNKQLGGKNIFSYELFISESKIQTGGASQVVVQEQIDRVCENYLKLVEIFKMNENDILGLNVEKNAELLEKLQIFVNKINEIIRNIHIFNSRFTNKVPQEEIDVIAHQMTIYEKDFDSNKKELDELVKFKINSQSGGALNIDDIKKFYSRIMIHFCVLIIETGNINYKKCLLKVIQYLLVSIRKELIKIPSQSQLDIIKHIGEIEEDAKRYLRLRGTKSSHILQEGQIPVGFSRGDTNNKIYDNNRFNRPVTNFDPMTFNFALSNSTVLPTRYPQDNPIYNLRVDLSSTLQNAEYIDGLDENQLNEALNMDIITNTALFNQNYSISDKLKDNVLGQFSPAPKVEKCIAELFESTTKLPSPPPPPPPPPPQQINNCPKFTIEEDNNRIKFIKLPESKPARITCNQPLPGQNLNFDTNILLLEPNTYIFTLYSTTEPEIECVTVQKIVSPPPAAGVMPKYCPTFKIVEGPDSINIINNSADISPDIQQLEITCDKFPGTTVINRTQLTSGFSVYNKVNLQPNSYKITITGIYSGSPNIPCGIFEKDVIAINQCPVFTVTEEPNSITITKNGGNTQNIQIRSEPNNRPGLAFLGQTFTSGILPSGSTTTFILTAIFPNERKECYRITKRVEPPPVPNDVKICPVFTIEETFNSITINKTPGIPVIITANQVPPVQPPRNLVFTGDRFTDNELPAGTDITYTLSAVYPSGNIACGSIRKTVLDNARPNPARPKQCPKFDVSGNSNKVIITREEGGDEITDLIIKCDNDVPSLGVDNIKPAGEILNEGLDRYESGKLLRNETYIFSIYVKYNNGQDEPDEGYLCGRIVKNVPPKQIKQKQCPKFNVAGKRNKIIITREEGGDDITDLIIKCDKEVDGITPDTILNEGQGLDEYRSGKLLPNETYIFSIYVKYNNGQDEPEEGYLCSRIVKNVPPKTKVLKEYQCPLFNISEKKKIVKITHRPNTGKNIERIYVEVDKEGETKTIPINELEESDESWSSEILSTGKHTFIIYTKYDDKEDPDECHKFTLKISDTVDTLNQCPTFTISETIDSVTFKHNLGTGNNIVEIKIGDEVLPLDGEKELNNLNEGENKFDIEVTYKDGTSNICHTYTKNVVKKKKETAEIATDTEEDEKKEEKKKETAEIATDTEEDEKKEDNSSEKSNGVTIQNNPTIMPIINVHVPGGLGSNPGPEQPEKKSILTIKSIPDNNSTIKKGTPIIITATANFEIEENSYTWFINNKEIPNQNSAKFETDSLQTGPGIIQCKYGEIESNILIFNIKSLKDNSKLDKIIDEEEEINKILALLLQEAKKKGSIMLPFKVKKKFGFKSLSAREKPPVTIVTATASPIVSPTSTSVSSPNVNVTANPTSIANPVTSSNSSSASSSASDSNVKGGYLKLKNLRKFKGGKKSPKITTINEPIIINPVVNYLKKFDNFDDYKGPTQSEKKLTEDIITEGNPGYSELDKVNYNHINKIFNTTGLNIDQENKNYELIQQILRHTKQSLPIYKRVDSIEEKETNQTKQTGGAENKNIENIDNLELWDKINSMKGGSKYSWIPTKFRKSDSPLSSSSSIFEESDDELPKPDEGLTEDTSLPQESKSKKPLSSSPSTPETSEDEGEIISEINPLFTHNIRPKPDEISKLDDEITEDTSLPQESKSKNPLSSSPSTPETSDDEFSSNINPMFKKNIPSQEIKLNETDEQLPSPDAEITEDNSPPPPPRSNSPFTKGPSTPETSNDKGEFTNVNSMFSPQRKRLPEQEVRLPEQEVRLPEQEVRLPKKDKIKSRKKSNNKKELRNQIAKKEEELNKKNEELDKIRIELKSVPSENILKQTELSDRKTTVKREIKIIKSDLEEIQNNLEQITSEPEQNSTSESEQNSVSESEQNSVSESKTNKLTKEELDKLNVTSNNGEINQEVLPSIIKKIDNYSQMIEKNNEIDVKQYTTVYFTSDIHSDYVKFVNILKNAEIIKYKDEDFEITDSNMYDSDIITKVRWIPKNTIFIILGDLIDGKRKPNNFVNDKKGSSEFLLHAFIYNLRFSALKKNSNIIFTLGNHDHHSIVLNEPGIIRDYATETSLKFFKSSETRSDALLPFYKCSPYYYVFLKNGDKIEVSGVHGEFIDIKDDSPPINKTNFDKLQDLQNKLNQRITNFRQSILETDTNDLLGDDKNSILWARNYSKLNDEADNTSNNCNKLSYPLTVVGHCPTSMSNHGTNSFTYISQLLEKRNKDISSGQKCDINLDGYRGCVALGCENESDRRPKLAFVDIAMSHAFFEPTEVNKDRIIEILKLDHTITDPKYYYDTISLKIIDKNSSKEEKIWSSSDQQEIEKAAEQVNEEVAIDIIAKEAEAAQKEAEAAQKEAKVAQEETSVAQEEAKVARKEAKVAQEEASVAQEEAKVAQEEAKVAQEEASVAHEEAQEAKDEADFVKEEAEVIESEIENNHNITSSDDLIDNFITTGKFLADIHDKDIANKITYNKEILSKLSNIDDIELKQERIIDLIEILLDLYTITDNSESQTNIIDIYEYLLDLYIE